MERILFAVGALAREQQTEWRAIHGVLDDAPLTLNWETLPRWSPEHREAVAVALHDMCFSTEPSDMLAQVTASSRRVGAWLACAVAHAACVNTNDARPGLALEWAQRRVRGTASYQDCRVALSAVTAYMTEYRPDGFRSAYEAGSAARSAIECAGYSSIANAPTFAKETVTFAMSAFTTSRHAATLGWTEDKVREFLRRVVAGAIREALDAAEMGYKVQTKKED